MGSFQHFQNKEKKLLVMTSKCIKLRICTLSCCSETHCLNYKYNIKVYGKIKINKETLRTKVDLVIFLMFCDMNYRFYLRGLLSFLPSKTHLQCQYCGFCFIISKIRFFWNYFLILRGLINTFWKTIYNIQLHSSFLSFVTYLEHVSKMLHIPHYWMLYLKGKHDNKVTADKCHLYKSI